MINTMKDFKEIINVNIWCKKNRVKVLWVVEACFDLNEVPCLDGIEVSKTIVNRKK